MLKSNVLALGAAAVLTAGFGLTANSAQAASVTYSQDFSSGTGDWAAYPSTVVNSGSGYATINNSDSTASGAYSHLGGNSHAPFNSATSSLDVYVDPGASINGSYTYQWDLSNALYTSQPATTQGNQDFVFHADGSGGNVNIFTSNGSSDAPVANPSPKIGSPSYTISSAGWYTFKWDFQNDGSGNMQATMSLFNQGGSTALFTQIYDSTNDPSFLSSSNYDFTNDGVRDAYEWFTYLTPDSLNIDNQHFTANVVPVPATLPAGLALLGLCGLGMVIRRRRRCA